MLIDTPLDFQKELELIKPKVWNIIKDYLPNKEPIKHYQIVNEYPQRQGKYFRPALVLLATELFGGNKEEALLTAAAMQLSEDWLLLYDDYMDESEERRNLPTLHRLYGSKLAINAGVSLQILMWKILGDNIEKLGLETGLKIHNKFSEILLKTIEGQFTEVSWIEENRLDISEEEYLKMIDIKAGLYTVIGPLQLGAIIAGASNQEINDIENWGLPFGRSFQIWDDIMNLITETKLQGKENGGDILEGKRTLILIHLLKNCTQKERVEIENIYSKPRQEKSDEEKNYIIELMKKYSSIKNAEKIAKDLSDQAKSIFNRSTKNLKPTQAKEIIKAGIDFVVNRVK